MTYETGMKPCLHFAMELSLLEVRTYRGYKGANILKLSFRAEDDADKMVVYCQGHEKIPKKSLNTSLMVWEVYCPYELEDIYELKKRIGG